eukprot:TRINITY_DN20808_c0_g1_i6.p2 TRINITY_DN20808_c0_g1~~TRINITY_DN20808_c0_g1_i6.p2  ORF type:complete len:111 (-),score=0.32 TRINITY_DN20808_c0_g1_i6:21-353(-)
MPTRELPRALGDLDAAAPRPTGPARRGRRCAASPPPRTPQLPELPQHPAHHGGHRCVAVGTPSEARLKVHSTVSVGPALRCECPQLSALCGHVGARTKELAGFSRGRAAQ